MLAPCIRVFALSHMPFMRIAARAFSVPPGEDLLALLNQERAARVSERAARTAAEARAAAAEAFAADERAARAAVDKRTFFASMAAISSSSSTDTRSHVDVFRRGAPAHVEVAADALFAGIPPAADATVHAAWGDFLVRHAREWRAPPPPRRGVKALREVALVHPSVGLALRAAAPRSLRVWHDEVAADDVPHAEIKPDFSLTDVRDALSSTIGGLVLVEAKLPRAMKDAVMQTTIFLRRRALLRG